MKILVIEESTNRPLANTKIQLQIKGKDAGFISLTTDASGHLTLEETLKGQQIAATTSSAFSSDPSQVKYISAVDGARLVLATSKTTTRSTETTQGGRSGK